MTSQSTVASLQNIRKQRQLELELLELDRQWHTELKVLARERLTLLKELCSINQDRQEMEHLQDTMQGGELTRFTDKEEERLQRSKELKNFQKFSFEPDLMDKMSLNLPVILEAGNDGHANKGEDVAKVFTAKDLNKQRVQLQKMTLEQCNADRRQRGRAFADRTRVRKQEPKQDRNGFRRHQEAIKIISRVEGEAQKTSQSEDGLHKNKEPLMSFGLPAIESSRKRDMIKLRNVADRKRRSATVDYLPFIPRIRGHDTLFSSLPKTSLSMSDILPSITET